MNIILFHSGKLPEYLECTFKQIRLFNPEITVWFITDVEHFDNPLFDKYQINITNKDCYNSEKINKFKIFYKHPVSSFWVITAVRLIYIEEFLKREKLTDVYLFENDVLLYYSLEELHQRFVDLYKDMAITIGGPDKCMTGFMFIHDWKPLAEMTKWFIDALKQGQNKLKEIYHMDMVNEMTLMKSYMTEHSDLSSIPTMPFGLFYPITKFNSIFDPASWGQFVGGNVKDKQPGFKAEDHYIGQMLLKNPEFTVIWKRDEQNRNIPYFKHNGNEVRINNLHIHSKELHKYMSI